jgi:hypothetical protein
VQEGVALHGAVVERVDGHDLGVALDPAAHGLVQLQPVGVGHQQRHVTAVQRVGPAGRQALGPVEGRGRDARVALDALHAEQVVGAGAVGVGAGPERRAGGHVAHALRAGGRGEGGHGERGEGQGREHLHRPAPFSALGADRRAVGAAKSFRARVESPRAV